jgi:hypothetical protein
MTVWWTSLAVLAVIIALTSAVRRERPVLTAVSHLAFWAAVTVLVTVVAVVVTGIYVGHRHDCTDDGGACAFVVLVLGWLAVPVALGVGAVVEVVLLVVGVTRARRIDPDRSIGHPG